MSCFSLHEPPLMDISILLLNPEGACCLWGSTECSTASAQNRVPGSKSSGGGRAGAFLCTVYMFFLCLCVTPTVHRHAFVRWVTWLLRVGTAEGLFVSTCLLCAKPTPVPRCAVMITCCHDVWSLLGHIST